MWRAVVLGLVVATTAARADDKPLPLELTTSVEHAAKAGKPLIVELYAEWCGPCKWFEKNVLPRPDVQEALAGVELVRYDIDQHLGETVADAFETNSVPTFLALDGSGKELARMRGLDGRDPAGGFVALVQRARAGRDATSELEARVANHPDDAAARLALAKLYRSIGRDRDARGQLELVASSDDRRSAAEAAAELNEIDLAKARVQEALDKSLEFVTRFPDSPQAAPQLVLLGVSGHIGRSDLRALVEKHLQTVSFENFAPALRVALITANMELARHQIVQRAHGLPQAQQRQLALLGAELDLYEAFTPEASTKIVAQCGDSAPDPYECYLLEQAIALRYRLTQATTSLVRDANAHLEALEHLRSVDSSVAGIEVLESADPMLRTAVAGALRQARHACGNYAPAPETVVVHTWLGPHVTFRVDDTSELAECVHRSLLAASIPMATVEPRDITTPVYFTELHERPRGEQPHVTPRWIDVAYLARLGAVSSQNLYLQSQLDFGGDRFVRQLVGAEGELGAGAEGANLAARARVGLGVMFTRRFFASAAIGVGVSKSGQLERALEVPFDARLEWLLGRTRVQLWVRSTKLFKAPSREAHDNLFFNSDESTVGLGASHFIRGRRLFLGFAIEHRVAGTSYVGMFGIPFGGF